MIASLSNRNRSTLLAALAGLALSAGAFAQSAPANDSSLKGPDVVERRAPRAEGDFGGGGPGFKNHNRAGDGRAMMQAYRQAFGAVLRDDASADVKASDDQKQKIEAVFREHAQKVRDFMEQHRDEIRALRSGSGDEKSKGANRQKVEELMKAAPSPKDAFNQAWQLLTPAQQTVVKAKLDEAEKDLAKQREDHYVERRAGRGKGDQPAPEGAPPRRPGKGRGPGGPGGPGGPEGAQFRPEGAPPPGPGGPGSPRGRGGPGAPDGPGGPGGPGPRAGAPMPPDQQDRLMGLLSRMSPEQREQLLRRLEERVAQGGRGEPGDRPAPRRRGPGGPESRAHGEPKPAPPMDEVNVPQPTQPMEEP